MTRMEQLYSMKMKELVVIAEELGIKVNKKGKTSVAAEKIYAAEQARIEAIEAEQTEVEAEQTAVEVVEEEVIETAKRRKNAKATFEELLMLVPNKSNLTLKRVQGDTVAVKIGKARIFRLHGGKHGTYVLVTDRASVADILESAIAGEYDEQGVGWGSAKDYSTSLEVKQRGTGKKVSWLVENIGADQVTDFMKEILANI